MNPNTNTAPASNATLRLAEANRSAPFAAYPGWQLDVRATLDSHNQMRAALYNLATWIEADAKGYCAKELRTGSLKRYLELARAALAAAQS